MNRRDFIRNATVAGGSALLLGQRIARADPALAKRDDRSSPGAAAGEHTNSSPRELTVAGLQMFVTRDVKANEGVIHRAIDQAAGAKADFLLTPEGSLSGYSPDFDQAVVAGAVQRVAQHAKEFRVGLLLGTCYKETGGYCYDQVRVHAPGGEYLGAYSKILLCSSLDRPGTGEMRDYVAGTLKTFSWDGITFGVLICNDLWATPGYTTTSNPYLAWQLKSMGARIIFHAVNATGPEYLRYRPYHETNQNLWALGLKIPIVTTNAVDGANPTNCRAGVIGPDGERRHIAGEVGEQFFSYKLVIG
jgi:predicted amidohydrolase